LQQTSFVAEEIKKGEERNQNTEKYDKEKHN
jgi:hypothetical protein